MSEANEEVTEKNQSLFEGCNFRFEGLKSEIEKAFVNLVEDLGAEVSDDAQITFVQKCYFLKKKNTKKRNLYDIGYIMDSVQAGKAISLDNYRFVPHDNDQHLNDEPMCYAARYFFKTDSCHKCFYDKVFCIECAKQNKESPIASNGHRILIASDSSLESEKERSESPSLILRKKGRDDEKVMQHESKSKKRIISSASDYSNSEEQSTSTRKCFSKKRFESSGRTVDQNESSETEVENETYKRNLDSENDSYETNSEKPRKVVSERNIVKRRKLGDDTSDAESSRNKNFKEVRNGNCGIPFNKRSLKKVVERNVVSERDSDNYISDAESSQNENVKVQRNENCENKSNKNSSKKIVERNIVWETDSDEDVSDAEPSRTKHVNGQRNGHNEKKATKTVLENDIASKTETDDDFSDARTHKNKNLQKEFKKSSEWIKASTSKTSPAKMKQHLKELPESDFSIYTDDEEQFYFKEKKWWLNHEIPREEECTVPCCSYEPVPHRRHWAPRRFLSYVEKKIILKYLIITNSIHKAKGKNVFENMLKDGYLAHRTGETLRNSFRRYILKEIKNYGLPAEIYKQFAPMRPRVHRKMKFKQEEEYDDD